MTIVDEEDVDIHIEVIQCAKELKQDLNEEELRARIKELESDLESYREEYGHESPEEADQFGDIDELSVQEWAQRRANKAVAKLALRLSEAVTELDIDRHRIADMPDLGRSPLPDRDSEDEPQ